MGKTSPKELLEFKRKRQVRTNSRNNYLRPGALAQLRYSRVTTRSSCTDIGKKRVLVLDSEKVKDDLLLQSKVADVDHSPSMLSPERTSFRPAVELTDEIKQQKLPGTPKTPRSTDCEFESRLESLPIDILVKIMCHLHHDQLSAVFHVSKRIRKAVLHARQLHFNYTTPDRSRQEMLRTKTPLPTEHWPFVSKGDGRGSWGSSPHTPKAPKHGPRPPSRLNITEMRQIAAVLFQESAFPKRCKMPPGLPKPPCKSLASNRVLFYEDELCQAVAQNKLR
ncbi:F-box protein At4g35930 [Magnolia sinica]|uniref:F-box protein At4g35930 n=1 Tax=Magnolia sinica TaxID=86752 RepID=UPI002658CA9E|nr:F-box protein At4g35930 [Magnolia sinica]XP_058098941.1 F-box protein At4g35930 [Magnolia sinica]XP_058098942.1 F-box protein At4g35930 [Magnolia sinica]XP_058098943.1 F-box protein At4g35930 [Magnolia sinica]XP_058098944.1 F-box protein At4g35930 [Magnolia sinica]